MSAFLFPFFHQQHKWKLICSLLFLQLWIGIVLPVAMTPQACPETDMSSMTHSMAYHDVSSSQCQQNQHHHNVSCQQLCACFNGLIASQVLPVVFGNHVYSLMIYHLFSGISFSPPLPPPK